jgi:predicted PurR-regulated permease PerM
MFSVDDRTGNVVTTAALFLIAAAILYLARVAFLIVLASVLFAHLLEPAVRGIQLHSRLGRGKRNWAIAQVYLVATLAFGGLGYQFGSGVAAQLRNFNSAVPEILQGLFTGQVVPRLELEHRLNTVQQLQIHAWLVSHQDVIAATFRRGAASAAHVAANAAWLLAIPVLAIFILLDGRQMGTAIIKAFEAQGQPTAFGETLRHVNATLANFVRAQLILAASSFAFYTTALLILGFPYALPLGMVGGILEFLPAAGWIVSAAFILTIGILVHAHWIWMASLIVVWRVVQDYVNSPRIMGRNLQLPPFIVLVALMIGGQVGGIAGIFLSVPIVAVLRTVWLDYCEVGNPQTSEPTTQKALGPIASQGQASTIDASAITL